MFDPRRNLAHIHGCLQTAGQVSKQLYTSLFIYLLPLFSILFSYFLPISSSSSPIPFLPYIFLSVRPQGSSPSSPAQDPPCGVNPTYDEGRMSELNTALPRITIEFCTQCKWMLRAAYVSSRCSFSPVVQFPSETLLREPPLLQLYKIAELQYYTRQQHHAVLLLQLVSAPST